MTMSCCRYPGLRKNLMMLRPRIHSALGHLGRLDTYELMHLHYGLHRYATSARCAVEQMAVRRNTVRPRAVACKGQGHA